MPAIQIASGIKLPFYPMRPSHGHPLKLKAQRQKLCGYLNDEDWIVQPKFNGKRAVLGLVSNNVYVFNRHLNVERVLNADGFIKHIPNGSAFDGEIVDGVFYPFEALAFNGQSFLNTTTSERLVLAYQFTRLMGLTWLFGKPTESWIMRGREHAPKFDGVVLKRARARYVPAPSATTETLDWLKCRWV